MKGWKWEKVDNQPQHVWQYSFTRSGCSFVWIFTRDVLLLLAVRILVCVRFPCVERRRSFSFRAVSDWACGAVQD